MKKKNKNNKHLFILGILLIVFFTIMILSTALQDSSVNYSYNDELNLKSFSNEIKVGNVDITNNGFMPVKIKLPSLRACVFDENFESYDLYVSYSKADREYLSGLYRSSIELKSYESDQLGIYVDSLPYPIDSEFNKKTIEEVASVTIYLFEVDRDSYYGFCREAKTDEAFHSVFINFQNEE